MNRFEIEILLERAVKCFEDMEVEYDVLFYGETKVEEISEIIRDYYKLLETKIDEY